MYVMEGECSIKGCIGLHNIIKGYCPKHYQRYKKYGDPHFTQNVQGRDRSRDYRYKVYTSMQSRCNKKTDPRYKDYGGRGIRVCDSWGGDYGFEKFCQDMGIRHEGMTLDRMDNNGNYCKENCRWSTIHQQAGNRRTNNEFVGVTKNGKLRQAKLRKNGVVYQKYFKSYDDAKQYRLELEYKYLTK